MSEIATASWRDRPHPEYCGFTWPLLDPNEEDAANNRSHYCLGDPGHDGAHHCACGERHG